MGLVKTRRLAYPPLAGADDPWGSRQAERCECRAMQKQQRAKAGVRMKALPKATTGKGVRSPSRKLANALTSALRSTT